MSLQALRFAQDKLREAISNTTMAFSARHTGDCHGPSGLAMTFCKGFLQNTIYFGHPSQKFARANRVSR